MVYADAQTWLLDRIETAVEAESQADDRLSFVRRIDHSSPRGTMRASVIRPSYWQTPSRLPS